MSVRREVLGDAHVDASLAARVRGHRRLPGSDHPLRLGRDLGAAGPRPAHAQLHHADRARRRRPPRTSSRCTCAAARRNGLDLGRDQGGAAADARSTAASRRRTPRSRSPSRCTRRRGAAREPGRDPLGGAHADRALRRGARGRAPRRPGGGGVAGRGRAGRGRRRSRSRTSTSAARTRRARTTATSPAWRCCWPGFPQSVPGVTREPAVRLGALGGRLALPRGRRRRRRPVRRRRGRVDDARAALDAQARPRVRARPPHGLRHDARLALSQPAPRGDVPAREHGGDGRERGRALGRLARRPGRVRPALAARWAAAQEAGRFADELVPVGDLDARRASPPRHDRREARRAEARVPRGRQRHGGQLERDERRRRRARDRERGAGGGARRRAACDLPRQRRRWASIRG